MANKRSSEDKVAKSDYWKPKFTQLVLVPKLNIRTDYGDLDDLNSIKTQGVKQPMRGWREKDKYYVVDGHRRYAKLEELYKKDKIDREVPFILEPRGYTMAQRIIDMFILGTGKALEPLEQWEGIRRLKDEANMSEAEIARQLNLTPGYINRLSNFSKAKPELKEAVTNNTISATTAVDLILENKADQFIQDLQAGKFDKPEDTNLFSGQTGGGSKAVKRGKTARIKSKDLGLKKNKKTEEVEGEVKEKTANSWALTKAFISSFEGKPADPFAQKMFLFLGKIINNKVTEATLKTTFKK